MLRRALTYQLILAVAVGPLLCCCSAWKALASSPTATSRGHVPFKPASPSCCSHKQAPAKPDPVQKQAPTKPGHPTDKCPCKDGTGKIPIAQPESTQTAVSTFLLALALHAVASLDAPATEAVGPSRDGAFCSHGPGARLTTSDLLYAHHNLRC